MRITSLFALCLACTPCLLAGAPLHAQAPPSERLTLAEAKASARLHSPEVEAARQGVVAATGRARQAGAWVNPTLSYNIESVTGDGQSDSQSILGLEQSIEIGGQRGARREAAAALLLAAKYRLADTERRVDFEVTRTYATAASAGRRAALAGQAATAFARAVQASEARLNAGDVSGYQHRRLALEAARYGAADLAAQLARDSAVYVLGSLTGLSDSLDRIRSLVTEGLTLPPVFGGSADSLVHLALTESPHLLALQSEAAARAAEARLAAAERVPTPVLSGGYKRQEVNATVLEGFVAGVSVPLPVWDRRAGAVSAARADSAQWTGELEALRRQTRQLVVAAYESQRAIAGTLALLAPQLGANAGAARHAAETAYREGEIGLLEWLDAARAYTEAEGTYATLWAEYITRRAALERALGAKRF
jgi:cobalt-zinc-cadmium efflux system outer membrane protein